MRPLLTCLLAASCSADAGASLEVLSGDSGDPTEYRGDPPPVPDLGLELDEHPDRLDLPPASSCKGMDFLFVVDNSGSMSDEQQKLAEAVPGFVDHLGVVGVAAEGGMHVGVVTTDAYQWNEEGCRSIGALVTETGSYNMLNNAPCGPFESGARFMTEQDDLSSAFTCAARVGTGGSGEERPIDAMLEALDYWHGRDGGCNDGFHRKAQFTDGGAVTNQLVIVILTDEDDVASGDDPAGWVEHLEFIRGTDLDDVVLVAVVPTSGNPPFGGHRLREFASLLPNSYVASISAGDYAPALAGAAHVVKEQCGVSYPPEQ